MTENEIRDLFRDMRETPVPSDSLVRVRTALERRLQRRFQWKIVAWATAVAAVMLATLLSRPAPVVFTPPPQMAVANSALVPLAPEAMKEVRSSPVRHAVHRRRLPKQLFKPETPIVIEIETPDPEVLIRLIGE